MMPPIFKFALAVFLSSSLVMATDSVPAKSVKPIVSQLSKVEIRGYGPELPPGEDGQANLDAAQKLRIFTLIASVVMIVFVLVVLAQEAEEMDTSWN